MKYKTNPGSIEQLYQVVTIIAAIAAPLFLYSQIKALNIKEDTVSLRMRKLGL